MKSAKCTSRVQRSWSNVVSAAAMTALLLACGGGGGDSAPAVGAGPSTPPAAFRVTLDRSSVSFTFVAGVMVAPSEMLVATGTGTPPTQLYVAAIAEGAAIAPNIPLTLSGMTATARLQPRADLVPGDYEGRVLFLVCTDANCAQQVSGSPLTITYTVKVLDKLRPDSPLTVVTAETEPSKPLFGSVVINAPTGSPPFTWSAKARDSWVKVTRGQGSSGTSLEYEFDWGHISSMPNDFEQTAQIQLTTSRTSEAETVVGVRVRKALPTIETITPMILVARRTTRVVVRGHNFDGMVRLNERVQVTGGTSIGVARLSDKALLLDVVPDVPGEMTFRIGNAQSMMTLGGRAEVVPSREYDYFVLEAAGTKRSAVIDARTHDVYAANVERGLLQKLRCVSVGCGMDELPMPGLFDVGIHPNGVWLTATIRGTTDFVQRVAIPYMNVDITVPANGKVGGGDPLIGNGIANTNEGRAWIGTGDGTRNGISYFDVSAGKLVSVVPAASTEFPLAEGPWFSTPANGERLLAVFGTSSSDLHYLDASIGTLKRAAAGRPFRRTSSSDAGDRVLYDTDAVRDADFQLVGNLTLAPTDADYTLVGGAMSRDGCRAYLLGIGATARVFVFNTTTPSTAGPLFPMGSFDIADLPSCAPGPNCSTPAVIVKTAADSNTLFMIGNERFVVTPIPQAWRSASQLPQASNLRIQSAVKPQRWLAGQ